MACNGAEIWEECGCGREPICASCGVCASCGGCGSESASPPPPPPRPARVSVVQQGTKLLIRSLYDANFVSTIRCLGGKWDPSTRTWAVPARQAATLRELLIRSYGTDGGLPAPLVPKASKAAPAQAAPAAAPAAPPPRTPREVLAAAAEAWPRVEQLIVPAGSA